MEFGFTTAAYVVAAVLFILSLGGLSGQESAKRAVWYGIVGMALAVFATLTKKTKKKRKKKLRKKKKILKTG
jgi:NAD(P) transhydrogenase subunit beta